MKEISEIILKSENIWIYGAGKIGKRVCLLLETFDIDIKGIIVTHLSGNQKDVYGHKVFSADDERIGKDDCIIVAVNDDPQKEIMNYLMENGFRNYHAWNESCINEIWYTQEHKFIDRRKHHKKACFILAGYKRFLWENVFERLERYIPMDIDVCICSSGKYSLELENIAEKNGWSYICTDRNSVTLIQNIAFSLFDDADWIYKMDEDIFVTDGLFERVYETYNIAEHGSEYHIGFAAPLIPVNGYGYKKILKKYGCLTEYEGLFGKAYIGGNPKSEIERNPDSAKYMWGNKRIPTIDVIAEDVRGGGYSFCNVRFSIGFILFRRNLWERMEGYSVIGGNGDLGADEADLCGWCMNESEAIVVAENAVAGHFSFGKQTAEMRKYMEEHPERFRA